MDTPWEIELFGRLHAKRDNQEITRFRTQKTGALFAYLAFYCKRSHPREELTELFWPDDDLEARSNSFRVALNSLRRQLEPPDTAPGTVLLADRASVSLNTAFCHTDVSAFEAALKAELQAATEEERLAALTNVVELYRGELLPGYADWWIDGERQRLADAYLGALRRLIRHLAQNRDFDRALDYARRAVSVDPLREESHRLMIRLYIMVGRPAAALSQYRELERLLQEGLGITPSAATRELVDTLVEGNRTPSPVAALLNKEASLSEVSPAPSLTLPSSAPATPPTRSSLPLTLTRFFGREEEIARLLSLLGPKDRYSEEAVSSSAPRLMTLTGPGGAGKTRLAIEVANRMAMTFPTSPEKGKTGDCTVWFIPLADLTDPALIPNAILESLSLQPSATVNPMDQITETLRNRCCLLILDNMEQLLEPFSSDEAPAAADILRSPLPDAVQMLRALLAHIPMLTLLVTSRQRLNIVGEQEFPLPPLPTPQRVDTPELLHRFAGVQLFVDRAQAVQPDFQVTTANAEAVTALCQRLEGQPLAIELAAAWIQTLTPAQMLSQLEHRFDLLVSRSKDISLRHRTLRATIEWSYRRLTPPLQRFFTQLSVFRGGWTWEAAQAVCEEPRALEYSAQLRECSLLHTEEQSGAMRFRLLETLREYAEEQMTEEERQALQRRHALSFLQLAEEAHEGKIGIQQTDWLQRLETEHDNLRAALVWCQKESVEVELGLRLSSALAWFWEVHGHISEGRRRLADALKRTDSSQKTPFRATALTESGRLALCQGDEKAARAHYENGLVILRELGDKRGVATAMGSLALVASIRGDCATALALIQEALTLARESGHLAGEARNLNNLGCQFFFLGDHEAARALFEESMSIWQDLGDRWGCGFGLMNLGLLAQEQGDYAAALQYYGESLRISVEMEYRWGIAAGLNRFAGIAVLRGEFPEATRLYGAAEALCDAIQCSIPPADLVDHQRLIQTARSQMEETMFNTLWAEGRMLDWEQAAAYAFHTMGGSAGK